MGEGKWITWRYGKKTFLRNFKKNGLLVGQETTGTSQFLPGADEELAGYNIILNHDQQDKQVYDFSIDMLLWKHPSR